MIRALAAVATLIVVAWAVPLETPASYRGDKVFQLRPKTTAQLKVLHELHENTALELDFWVRPNLRIPVDLHVPSAAVKMIKEILDNAAIPFEVVVEDLQSMVDAERAEMNAARQKAEAQVAYDVASYRLVCPWWYPNCKGGKTGTGTGGKVTPKNQDQVVGRYVSHTEVNAFLNRMAAAHPSRASVSSIGNSYEGRDMRAIKITSGSGRTKPIVIMESTIHAREWLTQGTMNYLIDKLVREYDTDSTVKALLDSFDFYVIPVANPDGYEYTRSSSRLWRKTRKPSSSSCRGSDPNRNWDFHWGESGVSSNPCSDTYPGSQPFSEPETANIRDWVNNIVGNGDVKLYFSLHSYSELWLTPWAYGRDKPSDNSELMRVANIGESALQATHGRSFQVGAPPDILYAASGGSYDWAKGVAGIKYAYTLELRPSGSTWNGFIVPESTIIPSGEEVFAGLNAICKEIAKSRRG